jgi:hypothetical protein
MNDNGNGLNAEGAENGRRARSNDSISSAASPFPSASSALTGLSILR